MDQEEALKQIKQIRQMMTKASERILFSPWQWIEWGILIVVGCIVNILFLTGQHQILFLWIAIFILGGALETVIWMKKAQSEGVEPFNPFLMKMWGIAGSIILIGVIFSFVFYQINQVLYIPGLWLIIMGVALYSISILGARMELFFYGIICLVSGILAVSPLLDYSLYILMVSFGFGGIFFGIYMQIREKQIKSNRE
ncbi:hypothetical protein JXQ31_04790 [candidate division KSB1 bacterium]|nr:hypothetical protein [candidate division KSB1 bacterium]